MTRGLTSFIIRAQGKDDIGFSIEATVLSRITSPLPSNRVESKSWNNLRGLPLADPEYHLPGSIDVLLQAKSFVSVLRNGRRTGKDGEPNAFNTAFGWVLMGAVSPSLQVHSLHFFATTIESIDDAVGQFWKLKEVPEHTPCSVEDNVAKKYLTEPLIAIIWDYLDSGHMELVSDPFPADGRVYYLPHHGVYKLDSTTTKLRVVFDASSKCPNGSLNDTLLSGPKLQPDIVAVLLLFRAEPVAITADVKQMFRQIWIHPEHLDYQRIV
ncbi:uncharacterized protein LOC143901611 [Temnothorax americanus]|uniref:uncharacterized protein LOC143901611 n=1 Tax=Temnothorax americanus TaxID=1964332 RepID=UPI004067BC5E